MALRNYFSGCEGDQHFRQAKAAKARHILMSYMYLRKQKGKLLEERLKEFPDTRFLIDSGAHTLQVSMGKPPYDTWKVNDFENYLEDYVKWLVDNRKSYSCAVELDIPYCLNICTGRDPKHEFGYNKVEEWRQQMFAPLANKGIEIIYVWHGGGAALENWENICARYSYVGLPGELSSEKDFNKYITIARRYTTRIHGFAASVTGDSKLVLRNRKGRVFQQDIKSLFDSCASFEETSPREVYGYLPRPLDTWSLTDDLKSSFEKVAAVVKHRVNKRLYRIELRGGKTITGTEDHSFFALNKKGRLVEVKPSELSAGEHLVSSKGLPSYDTHDLVPEKDYEFFGLWFGDGYVGLRDDGKPSSVWCSKQDQPEIQKSCREFAARQHMSWGLSPNGREGYGTHSYLAALIVKLFGRVGEDKHLNHLFSVSRESQAAFLRGYFSADGSTKGTNKLISLSCYRREHLEVVQLLLERWDIRSGITDAGISGKGSRTWELAISDVQSREIFAHQIGFLQEDQTRALTSKNNTRAIAGCHRGLPVSLLREPGRLYRQTARGIKSRPVYSKDRRTAEIPQNFKSELLAMECEYLEIKAITLVSDTWADVYDLSVPTTERFFANGILAHNTKQSDFRDWPWFSVDSITWKTSEIYGTLIVWDERRQKLVFEPDKKKRIRYAKIIRAMGYDANAIVADTNYKEVTRFALRSMTAMEAFYVKRYAHRTFYYELRLPPPSIIQRWSPQKVKKTWFLFTPTKNFQQHAENQSVTNMVSALQGISAVQNWDTKVITQVGPPQDFLKVYFESFIDPQLADEREFKKEMAMLTAPPAPAPLPRTRIEDYFEANPVRKREAEDLTYGDLISDDEEIIFLESDLIYEPTT